MRKKKDNKCKTINHSDKGDEVSLSFPTVPESSSLCAGQASKASMLVPSCSAAAAQGGRAHAHGTEQGSPPRGVHLSCLRKWIGSFTP